VLALIVRDIDIPPSATGITFITESKFSMQVGFMRRPKNHKVQMHEHVTLDRVIPDIVEVLFIKSGLVEVQVTDGWEIQSEILESDDICIFLSGKHGLVFHSESEIWEVKQGPYSEKEKSYA